MTTDERKQRLTDIVPALAATLMVLSVISVGIVAVTRWYLETILLLSFNVMAMLSLYLFEQLVPMRLLNERQTNEAKRGLLAYAVLLVLMVAFAWAVLAQESVALEMLYILVLLAMLCIVYYLIRTDGDSAIAPIEELTSWREPSDEE